MLETFQDDWFGQSFDSCESIMWSCWFVIDIMAARYRNCNGSFIHSKNVHKRTNDRYLPNKSWFTMSYIQDMHLYYPKSYVLPVLQNIKNIHSVCISEMIIKQFISVRRHISRCRKYYIRKSLRFFSWKTNTVVLRNMTAVITNH